MSLLTDKLTWVDGNGDEWTLERTTYIVRCDWVLLDPKGEEKARGMATTGPNTSAIKKNATRQGRKAFQNLAP